MTLRDSRQCEFCDKIIAHVHVVILAAQIVKRYCCAECGKLDAERMKRKVQDEQTHDQ